LKFLVDECTGPSVARWLREQGHEVFSVYGQMRGAEDDFLLEKAYIEGWIIVTNDKDFGEKVVREGKQHSGVIILRLKDEKTANKIRVLKQLLDRYAGDLEGNLVIATETTVRIIRFPKT
jgi:predicted nuclease of predicted toxin-antitoxin system